jgi:hypothetical protein
METEATQAILELVKSAHDQVEKLYLENPAAKGSPEWLNKRRLLLADLSLHLVQAALKGPEPDPERLKRSLFAVLTLAHEFLPAAALRDTAEKLIEQPAVEHRG